MRRALLVAEAIELVNQLKKATCLYAVFPTIECRLHLWLEPLFAIINQCWELVISKVVVIVLLGVTLLQYPLTYQ